MTMDKNTALANQEKRLLDSFHDSIIAEIKDVEARERAACQREIERITQEFEIHLVEELQALESKLRKEYESSAGRQEQTLKEKWEGKLNMEVTTTVRKMTEQFLRELARQERVMMEHFKIELRKSEIKRQFDLSQQQSIYSSNVKQLRHVLECKNIANMMYILCMERRKCCKEKTEIEELYNTKINELGSVISQKDIELLELKEQVKKHIKEVQLRETCILGVIKQFQKFINFALRSAPTQAEFLLSIEKMLVFELTDAILKADVPTLEPCERFVSWKTPTNTDKVETADLEIKDYHNCFKELPPVLKEDDDRFLPAFTFRDKLYVREDFRNMLSQGIEMSQSNELWTPEVQVLMNTLKRSVRSRQNLDKIVPQKTRDVSEHGMYAKPHSVIQFKIAGQPLIAPEKPHKRVSVDDESISLSLRKAMLDSERPSIRTAQDSITTIDFSKVGSEEKKNRLLGARSSLELIIKKGSVRYIGKGDPNDIEDHVRKGSLDTDYETESLTETFEEPQKETRLKKNLRESYDSTALTVDYSERNVNTPFEYKNITDASVISEKISPELVLDTRDSLMLHQVNPSKEQTDFTISPRDSIEVAKNSIEAIKDSVSTVKKKPSKLTTAKDSVELLRQSKLYLKEPSCIRKEPSKSRSVASFSSMKESCCDKCIKLKESTEVLDGVIRKKPHNEESFSETRSNVKIAQVEVISIDREQNKSNVSFHPMPIVYEAVSNQTNELSKLYQTPTKSMGKNQKPVKDKFRSLPQAVKIVGETKGKESLQNKDEFTVDRIYSFISMIKEHPNLIKTFTACRR
nr:uncharacterized protein LOC111501809 [Leptinotarsa decemlineata]